MRSIADRWGETDAWALARAMHRLEGARRSGETRSRLGVADRRLLWLLCDDQPRTLREISQETGLEQSTVSRQVNAALAEGLVRRTDEDRGPRRLTLTPAGARGFEAEVMRHLRVLETALSSLPDDERPHFMSRLETVAAAYTKAQDEASET